MLIWCCSSTLHGQATLQATPDGARGAAGHARPRVNRRADAGPPSARSPLASSFGWRSQDVRPDTPSIHEIGGLTTGPCARGGVWLLRRERQGGLWTPRRSHVLWTFGRSVRPRAVGSRWRLLASAHAPHAPGSRSKAGLCLAARWVAGADVQQSALHLGDAVAPHIELLEEACQVVVAERA